MSHKEFIDGLEVSFNQFNPLVMPQNIFMGFGYNPLLREKGERLDMLEYVAWMKKLRLDAGVNFVTFWDASTYQVVNVLPKKRFCENPASSPSAATIFLETLAEELSLPKRVEIAENCALRNKYLWKLCSLRGSSRTGTVRSAADIFAVGKNLTAGKTVEWYKFAAISGYATLLCEAAQYVDRLRTKNPELLAQIFPKNDNPAAQMYLPMEIAEALYLQNNTPGVISGKYGPQSEKSFDDCILGMQEEQFQPYAALRSTASPRRPGYLREDAVLWTSSSNDIISDVVNKKSGSGYGDDYSDFVRGYLSVLAEPGEPLVDCAIRLRDTMRIEEVK